MNSNFTECVARGRTSEALVASFLLEKGWRIEDVTQDKTYQSLEIDLIAHKDGCRRSLEVKQENKVGSTGNLLLEIITNTKTGGEGWFSKCQADYIFWHDTQNQLLLVAATSSVREYITMEGSKAYWKVWKSFEGYGYKESEGLLLPLWHYEQHFPLFKYALQSAA